MGVKVAVVGTGGREHALCYGLDESPEVEHIYAIRGNAGIAGLSKATSEVVEQADIGDFALKQQIELVVIGPDAPVAEGLADQLRAKGIITFGPSQAAARLESSKAFATEFMQKHGIALPPSGVATDFDSAMKLIDGFGGPEQAVIKASGLAAGKGVFLPDTADEARAALEKILSGKVDGDGSKIVIQKRYHGPEVSIFVLSDGETYKIIPVASQDHKRLLLGDKGPNTGGMGVYAPLPDWMLNKEQWKGIETIADQTLTAMKADGTPYQGVLYMGLMLAEELGGQPIVIEYNARFGDPEAEVVIPLLLQNGVDLYALLYAVAAGKLADFLLPEAIEGAAMTICLASAGYPESPKTGDVIDGLDQKYPDVYVFHGGSKQQDGSIVTAGGRVLFVTGFGKTLAEASKAANAAIGTKGIHFNGMQYRTDIGYRAIKP